MSVDDMVMAIRKAVAKKKYRRCLQGRFDRHQHVIPRKKWAELGIRL
jgi:hypothetical protein